MTDLMRGKVWQFAECAAFITAGSTLIYLCNSTRPDSEEAIAATTLAFLVSKAVYLTIRIGFGSVFKYDPKLVRGFGWAGGLLSATAVYSWYGADKVRALGYSIGGAALGVGLREATVKGVDLLVNAATRA